MLKEFWKMLSIKFIFFFFFFFQSYIRCKHVEYCSQKEEAFYDIQLNLKGKKNGM